MSSAYERFCAITACRARLLFPSYTVFVLDNGRSVQTCPTCASEIRATIKARKG